MSVVPTLAPSMIANAGTKSTRPSAANELVMRAVAVLLWSSAVRDVPAAKAAKRLQIRRRFAISSMLSIVAVAGFAAVAYLSENSLIAALLLLICVYAIANIVWQWRDARR